MFFTEGKQRDFERMMQKPPKGGVTHPVSSATLALPKPAAPKIEPEYPAEKERKSDGRYQ